MRETTKAKKVASAFLYIFPLWSEARMNDGGRRKKSHKGAKEGGGKAIFAFWGFVKTSATMRFLFCLDKRAREDEEMLATLLFFSSRPRATFFA